MFFGGLSFGAMESFSNYYDSAYGDLFPFLVVMVFLIARPTGLFSEWGADVR